MTTNISISQNNNVYTVKEIKTKTTTAPGKDPIVETTESVTVYKGKDELPENIRRQMDEKKVDGPINMKATRGNFAKDVLEEINKRRKIHGAEPLKMSEELVKHCEERARRMADKDDMQDADDVYGGSVTCMSSNDPEFYVKPDTVVNRWYSGSVGYDYKVEPEELTAGHFTQMIWKNSKEFGVAAAKSMTNQIYIVACFNPRGNYVTQFIENVCPPVSKEKSSPLGNFKFIPKYQSMIELSEFNEIGLDSHNKYRKRHGVPPLKYNKEVGGVALADYAQEWATELARKDIFEHRSEGKYGENLYLSYNSDPKVVANPSDACQSWYREIENYTFGREPTSMKTGHFTQLVWRDTREVGMGFARSKSGTQYIVANYYPPGNYIGRYTANVPKPR